VRPRSIEPGHDAGGHYKPFSPSGVPVWTFRGPAEPREHDRGNPYSALPRVRPQEALT
jgi:hypothetical protein